MFSRRIFIILFIKLFLLCTLIIRLFYLQVRESFYFQNLSEKNRTHNIPTIPKRGLIYDIFKVKIANNIFLWEVLFIKSQINQEIEIFVNTISSIINITDEEKQRIINDYHSNPSYFPILIKQKITQNEIAGISTFFYKLPGVFIRPFYKRIYPFKDSLAHVVGYTSLSDNLSNSNNIPNWHLGKYGMELSLDSFLRGKPGYSKYEVNASGNVIRKLNQSNSTEGQNIYLTIDSDLQDNIFNLLSRYNSASAIVSDIPTGNILAMASYPSFDPNIFTERVSQEYWNNLINNEKSPLSNKPLLGLYPPASTIKPIIMLLALENKIIDKNTTFTCNGFIDIGRDRFHCWKKKGHGKVNPQSAISESCDIYFYSLARLLDIKDIDKASRDFGFGAKHLSLLNEYDGRTVMEHKINTLGDEIVASIGQGSWLTTPIQLHKMICLFANGGTDFKFNILKSIEDPNRIIYPKNKTKGVKLSYSKENLDFINEALFDTINSPNGTGMLAATGDPNWVVAGKTGTAQVRRISLKEREQGVTPNHLLPWKLRNHALFVGYVPYENPQYAITIIVEHGGSSSVITAPLAKEIALLLRKKHPDLLLANDYLSSIK